MLENDQDFAHLSEKYSKYTLLFRGTLFYSEDPAPEGDGESRTLFFSDEYASRVCLGGMGSDPRYYFYGNINLNNVTLYTKYPVFGTISDGATITTGSVVLTDDGIYRDLYDTAWGGLTQRIVSSNGHSDRPVNISYVQVSAEIDLSGKDAFTNGVVGGLIGVIQNESAYSLTVNLDTVSFAALSGRNFMVRANHSVVGGIVGSLNNGTLLDTASVHNIVLRMNNTVVDGYVENCYLGGAYRRLYRQGQHGL